MTVKIKLGLIIFIILLGISFMLIAFDEAVNQISITGFATASGSVNICINNPPIINLSNCENNTSIEIIYNCDVNATDINNDNFSFSDNTTLFNINNETGEISFIADSSDIGNHSILITATDDSSCNNHNGTDILNLNILTTICGDEVCQTGETCNNCQADCGTCPTEEVPSAGGGGGGAPSPEIITPEFELDKEQIKAILRVNETTSKELTITNSGEVELDINIEVETLSDHVEVSETDFRLEIDESKTIIIIFDSDNLEPEVYTGELKVSGSVDSITTVKRIPLIIEVEEGMIDMDLRVSIPDEYKILELGDNLFARFSIIGIGEFEKINLTINYIIKDTDNNEIYSESEIVFLDKEVFFGRNIELPPGLDQGTYVLYVKAIYDDKTAVSSEVFQIIEKKGIEVPEVFPGELIASAVINKIKQEYLLPTILAIAIILLIILNILYRHHVAIKKTHKLHKKRMAKKDKRLLDYERSELGHSIKNIEKHMNLLKIGHELGYITRKSFEKGQEKLLKRLIRVYEKAKFVYRQKKS